MRLGAPPIMLAWLMVTACSRPPSSTSGQAAAPATTDRVSETPYLERRAGFHTQLRRVGPAPQEYGREMPPPGVQEVTYVAGNRSLRAWVAFPPTLPAAAKAPAVIYFHGGFAFGADDFAETRPFLEAGYAVMCPMLRGENGNPGSFELYFGEVEDAKAAIAWMAANERVDARRLYTFGHSAGGVISALLSLHDVPIALGGSAGGLYGTSLFDRMGDQVPFAAEDPNERSLRVLVGNVRWMKRRHHAFVGRGDRLQAVAEARREVEQWHSPLSIVALEGDHHSSLAPAVKAFLALMESHR